MQRHEYRKAAIALHSWAVHKFRILWHPDQYLQKCMIDIARILETFLSQHPSPRDLRSALLLQNKLFSNQYLYHTIFVSYVIYTSHAMFISESCIFRLNRILFSITQYTVCHLYNSSDIHSWELLSWNSLSWLSHYNHTSKSQTMPGSWDSFFIKLLLLFKLQERQEIILEFVTYVSCLARRKLWLNISRQNSVALKSQVRLQSWRMHLIACQAGTEIFNKGISRRTLSSCSEGPD